MKYKLIFAFFLFSSVLFSQKYFFDRTIGSFTSAASFYINSAGIIYVTDSGTNEILKLDTLGTLLKFGGGYGWNDGQFDIPTDVYANPLSVYASDKNNHRVESFDKDLNFISSLFTRDNDNRNERFGYPLSCALSQQGDLFILDSENKRIIKFDLFGNFVQNFGGYDAGIYSLHNPVQIAISMNNNIFVIDGMNLVTFDQYGNGISSIKTNVKFSAIRIIFNNLTLNSQTDIYYSNLDEPDLSLSKLELSGKDSLSNIISSVIFNKKLYVLIQNKILIFKAQ